MTCAVLHRVIFRSSEMQMCPGILLTGFSLPNAPVTTGIIVVLNVHLSLQFAGLYNLTVLKFVVVETLESYEQVISISWQVPFYEILYDSVWLTCINFPVCDHHLSHHSGGVCTIYQGLQYDSSNRHANEYILLLCHI